MMKTIFVLLLTCVAALAQQTVNNFTVKTNLVLRGTNVSWVLDESLREMSLAQAVRASGVNSFVAVGDSHTSGYYANVQEWTDADHYLFTALRWPNIVATNLSLGLTNRALEGSFMNDLNLSATYRTNSLTQLSVVPLDYTGLIALAHGYNDGVLEIYGDPQSVQQKFYRAESAVLGRVFAATYTNPQGLRRDGTTDSSFSTTGTAVDEGSAGMSPFPASDPNTATRRRIDLLPGQVVTFAATNAFVWFQPNELGNSLMLMRGTNIIDQATGYHKGYSTSSRMFSCLNGMGLSGTFTVTNISGTNMILAVGSILSPADATRKIVGVVSPNRLQSIQRGGETGVYISQGIRQAVAFWSDYPVYYCDWANAVDTATVPANDTDHPNPAGQRQMATAFLNARRVTGDVFHRNGTLGGTWKAFQVMGNFSSGSQFYPSNSVTVFHLSNEGYVDSSNPVTSAYLPLNIRASKTVLPQGGLISGKNLVALGSASTSDFPSGDQFHAQVVGGVGFADFFNWSGSSATFINAHIRSRYTDFSQGSVSVNGALNVRGTYGLVSDIPTGNQLGYQMLSGVGYFDSFNWTNSTVTYLPLTIRGTTVTVGTNLSVVSTASASVVVATNAYFTDRISANQNYSRYVVKNGGGGGYASGATVDLFSVGTYGKTSSGTLMVRVVAGGGSSRGMHAYTLAVTGGAVAATVSPTSYQQYGGSANLGALTFVQDTPTGGTDTVRFTVGATAIDYLEWWWLPVFIDSGTVFTEL